MKKERGIKVDSQLVLSINSPALQYYTTMFFTARLNP